MVGSAGLIGECVQRATTTWTLHKAGLYGSVVSYIQFQVQKPWDSMENADKNKKE